MRRIIYDGDSFYELDEECLKEKEESERQKEMNWQKRDPWIDDRRKQDNGHWTNRTKRQEKHGRK
ncbi:MAG: hypothetical protein LIO80_11115 [Lachnospiraceae bacterium]|nr:hypothetical protein [Lachnospiraceae bacterium]